MSATTDDEHLRELLWLAAEAAGPASPHLTDPLEYRRRSRRRRLGRVAATGVAAAAAATLGVFVVGGTTSGLPVGPPPRPASSAAALTHAHPGCLGVVTVTSSGGASVSLGTSVGQLTMHVGDTLSWTAAGPCGDAVEGSLDILGVLAHLGKPARFYTAVAPGVVRLTFIHPSCAGTTDPGCRGGIASSGSVTIRVVGP